jgi:hypothetical protein
MKGDQIIEESGMREVRGVCDMTVTFELRGIHLGERRY